MKKKSKSSAPKVDPYIDGLMAKLLERLVSLERKMDSVVSHMSRLASTGGNTSKNTQAPPPAAPVPVRHERMMYEAVCADCSKVCEVPFKPSEDRAVYCKTCWASRKGGGSNRPGMPVLRPVALPPKPVGKLHLPVQAPPKKSAPAKKSKTAKKKKK